jgi:hypothetical protein
MAIVTVILQRGKNLGIEKKKEKKGRKKRQIVGK